MLPTQTVTFISLSSIIALTPELDSTLEMYLDRYSFGDTSHTLIPKQKFIDIVGEMCNDDVITEEVYDSVYDNLANFRVFWSETFVDLET